MLFTTCLFDQIDEQNVIGDFARLCVKDINNGYGPKPAHSKGLVEHFIKHHPTKLEQILPMLSVAHKEYNGSSAFNKPELS